MVEAIEVTREKKVKVGDLVKWIKTRDERCLELGWCLVTFGGMVSLKDPMATWGFGLEHLEGLIENGDVIKAPIGTKIIITQEN